MKMQDGNDDDMAKFIAEQRLRLAHERETLQRNPPSAVTDYIMDDEVARKRHGEVEKQPLRDQEFMANSAAGKVLKTKPPTPQLFKLGEAYKQQKEKLKEELRQDYRKALAEKQARTTGIRGHMLADHKDGSGKTSDEVDLGLSLPIRDHLSAKERLRLERNREYNEFKTNKENEEKITSPRRLTTHATPISYPTPHVDETTQVTPPIADRKPVITETYQELLDRKRREEKAYRNTDHLEDEVLYRDRRKVYEDDRRRSKRVAFPQKRRARAVERYYDDDDDDDDETEEELIERLRARRQRKQRSRRFVESDDEDDDALFQRVRPRERKRQDDRRRLNSAESRSKEILAESDKQNDLRSKSAPPDQEFTGLPIGKVTSANTVQRKKDEYKLELQKQMEENSNKKKRSRELDLQMDAANELSNKKQQKVTARGQEDNPPESDSETKTKSKKKKKKTSFRKPDTSDSDSGDSKRRSYGRPYYPPNPYAPPANGYFPTPAVQFQSPYDEAYYYYGARNPLDPPGMGGAPVNQPPAPYQRGVSPLLAVADSKASAKGQQVTRFSEATKGSQRTNVARGTFHPSNDSSLVSDETRDTQKKKEMMQAYQDELKEQMIIKEKKKKQAKLEQEEYDKKMELETMSYNPWGKGGAGAPMKDLHGNLVSDLRQMHIQNEDLVRDPSKVAELAKQRQQMIENTEEIFQTPRKQETTLSEHLSPRFGRSNPFEQKETSEQKSQKDVYKDELQKQIIQRRRLEAERKEQLRIAEEKEEKKMEEENRKMQEEYEKEQRKQREKIAEQQRKNEELQRALEKKRLEEERRKKEEQRKNEEERRMEKERELQEKLRQNTDSSNVKTQKMNTARSSVSHVETVPKQVVTERVVQQQVETIQYPQPVTYERQHTPNIVIRPEKSRESKRISRELSALRKQLLNEQQRIETQLRNSDVSAYQYPTYQPTAIKPEAVVDLSRTRQRPVQVVHRPPTVDRPNSKALREFTDFKHRQDDTASLRMFRIQHPDTPTDTSTLEKQQEDMIKNQLMKIERLKNNTLDQPHNSRRSPTKSGRNGFSLLPPSESYASLLEAETTFVPLADDNDLENRPPSSPPRQARKSSARERRRVKRSEEEGGLTYRAAPDNYSVNSLNSLATLDIERMANKNQARLNKLEAIQGDEVSLTDPDDILDRFVNQQKAASDLPATPDTFAPNPRRPRKGTSISAPQHERSPSVNTVDTELWLRPGTGPPATAT